MALEITDALADLFPDTMSVRPYLSSNGVGVETYDTAINVVCRVSGRVRMVRDDEGELRRSTVQAIADGPYGLKPEDEYTLPVRFSPRKPKCISVHRHTDENGAHHETVYFE